MGQLVSKNQQRLIITLWVKSLTFQKSQLMVQSPEDINLGTSTVMYTAPVEVPMPYFKDKICFKKDSIKILFFMQFEKMD